MSGTIVDVTTLGKTFLYSLLAGVGIAVIFGAGVSSAAGLVEARRQGRTAAELAWGALTLFCLICAAGAVVLGIVVVSEKG